MKILFAFALLVATLAQAAVQTKTIEYMQGDTKLVGFLAYDDSKVDAKMPGVVIFPEWWGLTEYPKQRARQLAELGYVAFAADLYGEGKTTDDAKEAGKLAGGFYKDRSLLRARATEALEQLKKQPKVDSSKIAAIGYCFGGTSCIELALSGAELAGIVSFHGGLDLPDLDDAKNIKGKVAIFNGAADSFIKPEQINALTKALDEAKVQWTFVNFSGAVHAFTNPDADKHGIKGIAYNKAADQQSWDYMRSFLNEIFGASTTNH